MKGSREEHPSDLNEVEDVGLHTISESGRFPPYFEWRVDYVGWAIAKGFHFLLGLLSSIIILLQSYRVAQVSHVAYGYLISLAIGAGVVFFLLFYIVFSWRFQKRQGVHYFRSKFPFIRALPIIAFVAFFHLALGCLAPQIHTNVWILYIPALAIVSEYQPPSWRGLRDTVLFFSIVSALQLIPLFDGEFATDSGGGLEIGSRVLIIWIINGGFHYLIRNIQKRTLLNEEDKAYANELAQARAQGTNLEQFWTMCLDSILSRLRSGHGSLWVCYPTSGRLQLVKGLLSENAWLNNPRIDWTHDANCSHIAFVGVPQPSLVQTVAATGRALAWRVDRDGAVASLVLDGHGPDLFPELPHPPMAYQIAAPIRNQGGSGNVIGVLNVNYDLGQFAPHAQKIPGVLEFFVMTRNTWLVDWQRQRLDYTARLMSSVWERMRIVSLSQGLFSWLPAIYQDLRQALAQKLSDHLAKALRTTVFVWCYYESLECFKLNGVSGLPEIPACQHRRFRRSLRHADWSSWVSATIASVERHRVMPCPDSLLEPIPFAAPQLLIIPLRAKQGPVGVVAIAVQTCSSLAVEEVGVIQTYLDQVAYAVGNDRLLTKVKEQAQETERKHLRNQLHDYALQVSGFALRSWANFEGDWQRLDTACHPADLQERARVLGQLLKGLQTSIEVVAREGHFAVTHRNGVTGAIQDIVNSLSNVYECRLHANLDEALVDHFLEGEPEALFNITYSALSNAVKARAVRNVWVSLNWTTEGAIELTIKDDGAGFDPHTLRNHGHMGLTSMQTQAERIGWTFSLVSEPGLGTLVQVRSPVRELNEL